MREYTLIRSQRKTLALQLNPDGTLTVRAPRHLSKRVIDAFVAEREGWIEKHLSRLPRENPAPPLTAQELQELGQQACRDLPQRVARFAPALGVSCGRITIRAQRSKWGSCSSKGNLNFNCLLMLSPQEVRDYVVVHELCHLREMNHSSAFWSLVETVLPNYREQKQWLKDHGPQLMGRLP